MFLTKPRLILTIFWNNKKEGKIPDMTSEIQDEA